MSGEDERSTNLSKKLKEESERFLQNIKTDNIRRLTDQQIRDIWRGYKREIKHEDYEHEILRNSIVRK